MARRKAAAKRGARPMRVGLRDGHSPVSIAMDLDLLERAMEKLRKLDSRQAQVVHFRFYGGLSNAEIAELMQISESTVKRDWMVARAWLMRECKGKS